jgi:hypothetical protein
MTTVKSYWIKERHNPQFDKPYYSACGQLSRREAAKKEESLHGFNVMHEYKTEAEYLAALEQLQADGYTVYAALK